MYRLRYIGPAIALLLLAATTASAGRLVRIPAGSFLMGNNGNEPYCYTNSELPQHWFSLPEYWIGKHEVTRGEYRQFMEATGHPQPAFWDEQQNWGTGAFTQTENHPVVGVTYYDAEAYCAWAGGHLPTEAQWEKAARWDGDPRVYPWGDTWWGNEGNCNNRYDSLYTGYQTAPVGSYPAGTSPYGCQDMLGNVWEWCRDWYVSYDGAENWFDYTNSRRALRGGGWDDCGSCDYGLARCAARVGDSPTGFRPFTGFRFARDNAPRIASAGFEEGSKVRNRTTSYTDGWVFRRAGVFQARVELDGVVDFEKDFKLEWTLTGPHFEPIEPSECLYSSWESYWAFHAEQDTANPRLVNVWFFAPPEAAIGKYSAEVRLVGQASGRVYDTKRIGDQSTPSFIIIFNPFKDSYEAGKYGFIDDDVFPDANDDGEADFSEKALREYSYGAKGTNYYPSLRDNTPAGDPVDWDFEIGTKRVLDLALSMCNGESSAWGAAEAVSEKCWDQVLPGCWEGCGSALRLGGSRNTRDIINLALQNPKPARYGQCMDLAATLCTLLRNIGIPSRMLTCLDPLKCNQNGKCDYWWFHCWDEVWVTREDGSTHWCDIDYTRGEPICDKGPVSKSDPELTNQRCNASYIYTQNAEDGQRVTLFGNNDPIKDTYPSDAGCPCKGRKGKDSCASSFASLLTTEGLSISVSSPSVSFGQNLAVRVALTNTSGQELMVELDMEVGRVESGPFLTVRQFTTRTISVPAGGTSLQDYTLGVAEYLESGRYLVIATAGGVSATTEAMVLASHEIQLTAPAAIAVGASGAGTLTVTNRTTTPTTGVMASVSIPGNTAGPETNDILIGVLQPGGSYQTAFNVAYASAGRHSVEVQVWSAEGEQVRKLGAVEVYDPDRPELGISLEDTPEVLVGGAKDLTVTVWNDDVVSVSGIVAELQAEDEVAVATAQLPVPDLAPGEQAELSWTLQGAKTGFCSFSILLKSGGSLITEYSGFLIVKDANNEFELQVAPEVLPGSGVSSATISLTCQAATDVSVEITGTPGVTWGLYSGGQPVEPGVFPVASTRVLELRVTPAGGTGPVKVTARPQGDLSGTDTKTVWVADSSMTAKRYGNGEFVHLAGSSAAGLEVTTVFDGFFYVEEADRMFGIMVASVPGMSVAVRDKVAVHGYLATSADGERYVQSQSIQVIGQAPTPIAPLGINNRTLGGGPWNYDSVTGAGQQGITGGFVRDNTGLNNIGLLITTWGKFTKTGDTTFTLDDGSRAEVKCVVPSGVTLDPGWKYAQVTGISSCEKVGEDIHRLLRVRSPDDIVPVL